MTQAPETAQEQAVEVEVALTPHDWGRKTWRSAFLVVLARTRNAAAAARAVGISYGYAFDERKEDPVFGEAWREALAVGADLLEQVAWRRATVGEPKRVTTVRTKRDASGQVVEEETVVSETNRVSDLLLRDQLRAAKPELYGDRVQHTGFGDGPIQIEVGPRVRTVERLAELYEIALREGLVRPPEEIGAGPNGGERAA